MKRQRFTAVSAAERRNADLFLADLLGTPSRRVQPPRVLPLRSAPAALLPAPFEEEQWDEAAPCPTREEIFETWRTLVELQKLAAADRKEMESNPLVIEVQMLKQLADVLDMAKEVPIRVWRKIWKELEAFAACDVKPLVTRVKKGEKHANAVLRVMHGLTSILQGYVHDRIDGAFKSRLDRQKGFSKVVAKLLIHVIKKQVPVIQREIKADNFTAVAKAFEDLKKELEGQGFSVTGVWDVVVTLGKEIIGSAIEDALENSARWAAKKVAKKLLGSAAKAASAVFILEDLALFIHALATISSYKERVWAVNRVLLAFLARIRPCSWAVARPGLNTTRVGWRGAIVRVKVSTVIHSFAPAKGGTPGEGAWKTAILKTTFGGKTLEVMPIDVPFTDPKGHQLSYRLPPAPDWPAAGGSFVSLDVTGFDASGNARAERSLFVAACAP